MSAWTPREMMVVAASREIADGELILVGLGVPQIAALLAKATHAPEATLALELGVIAAHPTEPAMGIADPRMWQGAQAVCGMIDVLGYLLHGGRVTMGILGALEVDTAGSVNSSVITQPDGTKRRFTGSGGANDIASLAGRVMVVMSHDPRKFKDRVEFLTSPGHRVNGGPRAAVGLSGRGTASIVTDRAVIDVEDDGLRLRSVHPGEDAAAVVADTPVALASEGVVEAPPPSSNELRLIREEFDTKGWYTT